MADSDSASDEARVLRPLHAAACTYRMAFGPRAGPKVLTLQGAERGHGTTPAGGPVSREGLALASASAACKPCPGRRSSSRRCAPTSTGSACTQPCPAAPTTIGGVTNLAARLCAEAAGGQVLADRKIMARVEGLFDTTEIGPLVLKGLTHPVPAFSRSALPQPT